ncbi:MAG TPA: DUF4382 domain-containing protein [Bacteroidales bacterium]|nr:DUF4382 domain-containing protein [Bacteroidales bacterium]
MKVKISILVTIAIVSLVFTGCTKSHDTTGLSNLTFNLTDAPGSYDEVNIDVVGLQVIVNDSIYDLQTQSGIYNLLDLVNGKDTLIVEGQVPSGMLSQVRLILGDNNNLLIGSDYFDLKAPSAQQSGLKLNVHQDMYPGVAYEYTIDFDAGRSIIHTGSDQYILKPVLKVFSDAVSGAIEGVVTPVDVYAEIFAVSESNDTVSTFSDSETGHYMFRGLGSGSYSLDFKPVAPYNDTTLQDIVVMTGSVTVVDTVKFN